MLLIKYQGVHTYLDVGQLRSNQNASYLSYCLSYLLFIILTSSNDDHLINLLRPFCVNPLVS